jgi:AcrR family transcriptional regulator
LKRDLAQREDRGARARFRKLKPRPGQASAKVAGHQRARIHAATIELVGEGGYEGLTVTGIARAAGVSNHTFYENFSNKEDCFRSTYDLIVRHAVREILAARRCEADLEAKIRAGFHAFAREVSDNPKAARLALVEGFSSPAAFEHMQHLWGLFEALVAESFSEGREGGELPPLVVKGIVAGVLRVARARVLAEAEQRLRGEADGLMEWALSLCSQHAGALCRGSVCSPRAAAVSPSVTGATFIHTNGRPAPGDERTMIAAAVARLAAEEGYAALTVPRIRVIAGIPRHRFSEHFESVTDCFLGAVEMLVGRVLAEAREAYLSADSWPGGIHRALAKICQGIAADPILVKLVFFELYVPADVSVRWRAELAANLRSSLCDSAPVGERPTALAAEASVGAVWALLHHYATTGRVAELPRLSATASFLVLAPTIGAKRAVEAISAEEGRSAPMVG